MNVLIVNGSPRRQGNVARMLEAMRKEAEKCNMQASLLNIADLSVKPCTGCMACRKSLACVLPDDDAQQTLRLIQRCDVLIIGAPCYWGNMSGSLKQLFDRTVYALMGEKPNGLPQALHKGKKAVLVASCNTAYPFSVWFGQLSGVFRSLREILRWSGYRVVGRVGHSGARNRNELSQREIEKCQKIAACPV